MVTDNTVELAEAEFNRLWDSGADEMLSRAPSKTRAWTFYLLGVAQGIAQARDTMQQVWKGERACEDTSQSQIWGACPALQGHHQSGRTPGHV